MNVYGSYRIRKHAVQAGYHTGEFGRVYLFAVSSHDPYLRHPVHDIMLKWYEQDAPLWDIWLSAQSDQKSQDSRRTRIYHSCGFSGGQANLDIFTDKRGARRTQCGTSCLSKGYIWSIFSYSRDGFADCSEGAHPDDRWSRGTSARVDSENHIWKVPLRRGELFADWCAKCKRQVMLG